jgi:hypothetical protein
MSSELGPVDRAVSLAEMLAGSWRPGADAATSLAVERALLRLAGVGGLDRGGRPLAWAVVDRYLQGHPERLAGGVLLPFAMAAVEYDLPPQELALDVAAGSVDLALETDLLREPDRRAVAEAEAARFADTAIARIDANRTARRELLDVLGDAPRPWVGASVVEPIADDGLAEAMALVRAGSDVIRVRVPAGRELVERLGDAGQAAEPWPPTRGGARAGRSASRTRGRPQGDPLDVAPTGSQRGLARMRQALDEAAAERRAYVRLATVAPPLAAPEQAAVAAFERVDVVESDAIHEIVAGGVDPDRALADHAFAQRLHVRSGALLLVGPGPLVVGPDMSRGVPASTATLAGRALAMQLLGVCFAYASGVTPDQVLVGALPAWIADDREAAAHALAGVAVRRQLFPDHPLAFDEPEPGGAMAAGWPFVVAAALAYAGETALVLRSGGVGEAARRATAVRAAAEVAASVADARAGESLGGVALEHARAQVAAAMTTLQQLRDEGWRAVLGPTLGEEGRLAADASVERTEPFDPFSSLAGEVVRATANLR